VLHDRVAGYVTQCDQALTRLATARNDQAGRLLVRDGVPLWHLEQLSWAVTEVPDRVHRAFEDAVAEIRQFASDRQAQLYVSLGLLVALALLMYTARRTARRLAPTLGPTAPVAAALDHPPAAALLLTLLPSDEDVREIKPALAGHYGSGVHRPAASTIACASCRMVFRWRSSLKLSA
jgi:hypothetical protein